MRFLGGDFSKRTDSARMISCAGGSGSAYRRIETKSDFPVYQGLGVHIGKDVLIRNRCAPGMTQ